MRELLGEKVYEEDRPYVGNVLAGRRQRFTRERAGADGLRRWFDCEYLPDVDATGTVAGYYGLFTEISDIKRIELTARSNEAKFRTLTQLSSDYYWEQDEQLRFTITAARTDGRPGPPPQMRLGMRRWEVPGTEPVNTTWAEHQQVLAARAPFRELLLQRPDTDGQMRYVEVSGAPIFDERRSFTGYRGVAKDVTDRERALGELRKTIEAAEAASHAKSRFVAAMSHEVRAPMRDVLEKVTLLRATPLDATQARHIDAVQTSAATLLDVINDILDIARLDVGQLELEYCDFNLPDLTAGVLAAVEDAARAKNLRVTCHIDPRLAPQFRGDASRLRQVLHNLLDNAVRFTERGEVVLEVQPAPAAAKSAGPGHIGVLFRVRDTGIGMDEAAQARLFAAFVPASATPDRLEGSGLGLALCKRLAQLMGGSLSVQSRLNAGSTFSFAVPLQQVDAAARAARAQPLATP